MRVIEETTNMNYWIRILFTFILCFLAVTVSAQPHYERSADGNSFGVQGAVVEFEKIEGDNIAKQLNEELFGDVKERHKRLSDQRRAEIETLMALSKMTTLFRNAARGSRQLDQVKVGRRKRSVFDINMKNLRKLFRLSGTLGYKGNAAYPVVS